VNTSVAGAESRIHSPIKENFHEFHFGESIIHCGSLTMGKVTKLHSTWF